MLRLLNLSGLHVGLADFRPPPGLEYDTVVLAGDIHAGDKAPLWALHTEVYAAQRRSSF